MNDRLKVRLASLCVVALAALTLLWTPLMAGRIDFAQTSAHVRFEQFGDAEPWGRWSIGAQPRVRFDRPLPAHFKARLTARAFGANVGRPIVIRIPGGVAGEVSLSATDQVIEVTLDNPFGSSAIDFTVPAPQSPASLGMNADGRALGIGIASLEVLP